MKEKKIFTLLREYRFDELTPEYRQLITSAKEQTEKAYAPYSNFYVGAAVLLNNGEVFSGSNQENAAYPSGLCAERTVLFYANAQRPDIAVKAIAVAAYTNGSYLEMPISPCGACRQVLLESETRHHQKMEVLLYGKEFVYVFESAASLLPFCFMKESLQGE